ncbi:hypothetical protein [Streptomyces sp. NPDC051016]|uniref:hypothetical protein n=1 Tax=Streptomyces sp. NPDC051016 TaxID=3365638 RepID=UPI00378FAC24
MAGLAPQLAAFRRRLFNLPAPARSSGEASNGQPVQVEIYINGAWVDITAYVMVRDNEGKISITYGIRDEGSQTEQATSTLPLKNQDGRFTRRNPVGPYYGYIGRNTPCRISVPDGMGGKSYREQCEISKWPKSWDPSGTDVWVDVTANGLLQRLSQAPPPERSVIYNAVTNPLPSSVMAYWPMEDASGATSLASALRTGSPMTWTGVPALASYDGLSSSDPLPDLTNGTISGGVARYDDPTASQIRFLAYIPKAGLADGKILCTFDQVDYSAGSAQFFELYYSTTDASNSIVLRTCAADGTVLGAILPHSVDVRGRLFYVSVELQESGTSITRQLQLRDVLAGTTYTASDTETLTQLTRVTAVRFGVAARAVSGPTSTANLPGVAVGHCTVENAITAIDALGTRLNPIGETAGRRVQRLCAEQGIPFEWVGDLDDSTPMGAQSKQNALALIQECVLADAGLLYETRDVLGVGYRTRVSLYNQDPALVLDYTAYNLSDIPTPVEDDRYLANKVVVSAGGATATYEQTDGPLSTAPPPAGVGAYGANADSPLTLNLAKSDTPTLIDHAAWRVHLGTVDEDRFPEISVNLAHPSITPDMRRAILGLRMGDRIQIVHPPLWVGPDIIDQLILGTEETITNFEHRLTFTCQPSSPYNNMAVADDPDSRIDIDGSQLLSDVASGATSLVVTPSAGQSMRWTIDTGDMPFDVRAGGEIMRATAVTPWISDTFARTASSSWGTADTGQVWQQGGGVATDFSVSGGVGVHLLSTVNDARRTFVNNTTILDWDQYCDVAVSALTTGGSVWAGPTGRYIDSGNLYWAALEFATTGALVLGIRKRVNNIESLLGTYAFPSSYSASVFYRVRFQVQGAVLRAKVWAASDPVETPEWQVTAVDSTFSTSVFHGTRSISASANTNVSLQVQYANYRMVSPQTMTVTRSMNGVVKAQTAGTDVRLAYPTYIAL